jgi:formate hydrogenlyase transcriptional activator
MALLESYDWPGNVRELQNVIERSVILCETENLKIDESWLARKPEGIKDPGQSLSKSLAAQQKGIIEAALAECGGRVYGRSGAAAKLGMPPSTLDSKIKSLKIDKTKRF